MCFFKKKLKKIQTLRLDVHNVCGFVRVATSSTCTLMKFLRTCFLHLIWDDQFNGRPHAVSVICFLFSLLLYDQFLQPWGHLFFRFGSTSCCMWNQSKCFTSEVCFPVCTFDSPSQRREQRGVHKVLQDNTHLHTHRFSINPMWELPKTETVCMCVWVSIVLEMGSGRKAPPLYFPLSPQSDDDVARGAWSCGASWEMTFRPQLTKRRAKTHSHTGACACACMCSLCTG